MKQVLIVYSTPTHVKCKVPNFSTQDLKISTDCSYHSECQIPLNLKIILSKTVSV